MAHGKNKLEVRDHGWKQLEHRAKQLEARPFVKVGVLGRNDSRAGEDFGNVRLAITHEYGLGVPERPFLRGTAERMGYAWQKLLEQLGQGVITGKLSTDRALAILGLRAANDVKATIQNSLGLAPNAPATIEAKGSSRPLIDTGRLVGSIDFDVVADGHKG